MIDRSRWNIERKEGMKDQEEEEGNEGKKQKQTKTEEEQ